APWVATRNVHGTGCTFSAAIASNMALGLEPLEAAIAAKRYVHRAIFLAAGWELGSGHGPIDHLGAARLSRLRHEVAGEEAGSRSGAP
ncbi:MAG: bifunctional hydroxymethylpyrimidine kinase/phosphomethylpyrimidine kinase, partial [Acidimicrobiales bacterium]